jgi:hypothetical protein
MLRAVGMIDIPADAIVHVAEWYRTSAAGMTE